MSKGGLAVPREEAERVLERLGLFPFSVPAGSYRRGRKMVNDLDLVVPPEAAPPVRGLLQAGCDALVYRKDGAIVGGTVGGVLIELYAAQEGALGAMLLHATGSKAFNIWCRGLAVRQGWKLNQYGLFEVKSGERLAAKTEREILDRLGIGWVAPERREGGPWRSSTGS